MPPRTTFYRNRRRVRDRQHWPHAHRMLLIAIICAVIGLAACDPGLDAPPDSGLQAATLRPTQPSPTPGPAFPTPIITPAARTCSDDEIAATLRRVPPYRPDDSVLGIVTGDGFSMDGQPFVVRGVNYYPASYPWQRFSDAPLATVERDFARLKGVHANTVRLFLWYPPLFVCPGHGAVPNPESIAWLDAVIRLASAYNLRVILTLNHLPDLIDQPLYTSGSDAALAQTAYIVTRYRTEPTILAWDLRDAGDADYTPSGDDPAPFTRDTVLDWLARTAAAVRQIDPYHAITAGWARDSEATIALVDVVSLQDVGLLENGDLTLRERVASLRAYTPKPLLLIATGSSTAVIDDTAQALRLRDTVRAAEGDHLAGWLVWTMVDFAPDAACWPDPCAVPGAIPPDETRLFFGLWRVDGSRKPAANAFETLAAGS